MADLPIADLVTDPSLPLQKNDWSPNTGETMQTSTNRHAKLLRSGETNARLPFLGS